MKQKGIFIFLGPLLFLIILLLRAPSDMERVAFVVIACTVWIALWWLTEALPIGITSLLPLLLFPLCAIMPIKDVAGFYSNPIIFLFIGGFVIALAMERWNLHKRIALQIIRFTGTNQKQILLGFILATGFLSMWISNTATTMMMLPIALSIIFQFESILGQPGYSDQNPQLFGKALVMSIAYAASIGGMATIVGTPTNLIFVEFAREYYDYDVPFDKWFIFALPLVVVLGAFLWWHMSSNAFKLDKKEVPGSKNVIDKELQSLGKISYEEKWVLVIFILVAVAWISRKYLISPLFPNVTDTTIALIGAVMLFIIPSRAKQDQMIMNWNTAKRLPWEVILLFGGAFAVAGSFQASGLTTWIGLKLSMVEAVPMWLILLIIVAVVNYLTELTQNMATCTLMLPVLAGLSLAIDVHPFGMMVSMTIAASCAFMLPVATAPNAIVFGSGSLHMKDMVRAGFLLNIVSIILISIYSYFFLPLIWGIELGKFPVSF
ncbi:MAG: SLC13 family permease [Bacteroidota bacterium]